MAAPLPGGGAIAPPPAQPSIPALKAGPPFGGSSGGLLHPGVSALIDLYHRKKEATAYATPGATNPSAPLPGGLPGTQIRNPNGPGPLPIYRGFPGVQGKNYPGTGGDAFDTRLWQYYGPGGAFGNPSIERIQQITNANIGGTRPYAAAGTGADLSGYADYLRKLLQGGGA